MNFNIIHIIQDYCTDRIILAYPDGRREVKPWAWFEEKSREERERLKAWRR